MSTRKPVPLSPEGRALRAKLGHATRTHGPDHEVTRVLREQFAAEQWLSHLIQVLGAERLTLTEEQQTRLDIALKARFG